MILTFQATMRQALAKSCNWLSFKGTRAKNLEVREYGTNNKWNRRILDMEDELHMSSGYIKLGQSLVTCRHSWQQGKRPQSELPPPRTPEKGCFWLCTKMSANKASCWNRSSMDRDKCFVCHINMADAYIIYGYRCGWEKTWPNAMCVIGIWLMQMDMDVDIAVNANVDMNETWRSHTTTSSLSCWPTSSCFDRKSPKPPTTTFTPSWTFEIRSHTITLIWI